MGTIPEGFEILPANILLRKDGVLIIKGESQELDIPLLPIDSYSFADSPDISESRLIDSGKFFKLFEETKKDVSAALYSLVEIDVSSELSELLLYTSARPEDIYTLGYYGGSTYIFVNDKAKFSNSEIKVTLFHETLHYLISRANVHQEGLFSKENGKMENYYLNEGLVSILSEFYYDQSSTNAYTEEIKTAQAFFLMYGEDFLRDAFTSRKSVVEEDMRLIIGRLYTAFVIATDYYTQLTSELCITDRLFLRNSVIGLFQKFVLDKGELWEVSCVG